jgi:hypothetical protein
MKKSRFSEQQIAFILQQGEEGVTVEEVCRKAGINNPAPARLGPFFLRFGGQTASNIDSTNFDLNPTFLGDSGI